MGFRGSAGWLGLVLVLAASALAAGAQPTARNRASCEPDSQLPSEADQALWAKRYSDAELLYSADLKADPASGKAMAGLVRAALRQDKVDDALKLAKEYEGAHPNDPDVQDVLGEVRLRRGEVGEASAAFDAAGHLGPCDGRVHYDAARFLNLYGMHATAQERLEYAHALAPNDQEITGLWQETHAKPMTAEQQLAWLNDRLQTRRPLRCERASVRALRRRSRGIESNEKGSCMLVTPVTQAKVPMVPMGYGGARLQDMVAAGLDVEINGKRKRLEIDTGASGLLLSRSVANAAGLVPEVETTQGGIGDRGRRNAFVTHVDDIRIGGMEFKNCMVRVLEKRSVLGEDGLIGPDVFRDFVVTLDTPGRELRLGPLPRRPDERTAKPLTLEASGEDAAPMSLAERAKDRYTAPEMRDWTPVFRAGHLLIFPTVIGNAPMKLFMMDTGAAMNMISPAAAREVTNVSADPWTTRVRGHRCGEGQAKVLEADSERDDRLRRRAAGVARDGVVRFRDVDACRGSGAFGRHRVPHAEPPGGLDRLPRQPGACGAPTEAVSPPGRGTGPLRMCILALEGSAESGMNAEVLEIRSSRSLGPRRGRGAGPASVRLERGRGRVRLLRRCCGCGIPWRQDARGSARLSMWGLAVQSRP